LNIKKDRSTVTLQTNNSSSNNKNIFAGNNITNNTSNRKSFGNFITEPNDTTINSNSNFKDLNNNLAYKFKQPSFDYDNLRKNTETEPNVNHIQNRLGIAEKQHSNPLIKNSKIKKASITEYANRHNINYNSTGNQNATYFATPSNKIVEKDNFSSLRYNKFDKSKSKKESIKPVPEMKPNLQRNKSILIPRENNEKILNNSKTDQEKFNLQDNIQKTICEGLTINKENEAEIEIMTNNHYQTNLDFYKKSIDEHKQIMDSEHEMIADSLYDLAVHFLTFKNELLNSIKPTIINNQIHMNVNNYNQDNVNNIKANSNNNEDLNLNNDANPYLNHNNERSENFSINKSIFGEFMDQK